MNILCIDDDVLMLEYLKEIIKNSNRKIKIEVASDFKTTMLIIDSYLRKKETFEIIICDYYMPKIKGDFVLKHLNEYFPESIKILLSGKLENKEKLYYLFYSINNIYYLEKPIIADDLLNIINADKKEEIYG